MVLKHSIPMASRRRRTAPWWCLAVVACSGCSLWRPNQNKLPEYQDAKNAIEGYTDDEGNWVRPEGARAEKKKGKTASVFGTIPGFGEKPPDKPAARAAYLEGDALFEQAKNAEGDARVDLFRQAGKKYKAAAKLWRSSALEQDALMMAGESYYFAEDYPDAEDFYVRLIKEYPRTRYLDKADQRRMEIALYWLKYDAADPKAFYELNFTDRRRPLNDDRRNGVRMLEKMRLDNPTGKLADDATMELASHAFQRGEYQESREIFEDLRLTYPDSPHQFEAHFLGLKAAMETYQGPQYAIEPLDQAEKLVKQTVKQFPQEAREHQEYLNRSYAEIRYKRAERVYDQATFRLNRQENRAAQVYLDRILTEFSDTPFAEKARADQERIKSLPGEPQRHFQWLANLFPESSKTAPLLQSKDESN